MKKVLFGIAIITIASLAIGSISFLFSDVESYTDLMREPTGRYAQLADYPIHDVVIGTVDGCVEAVEHAAHSVTDWIDRVF